MSDDDNVTEMSTAADSLPVIPGYDFVRVLGKGGMGEVYLARQVEGLERDVAIKTILSKRTEAVFHKKFVDEGQRQAELHHANILPIFAAGEHDDTLYLVMHFARDGSLRDRLESGPLPEEDSITVITQVLKALRHAHSEQDPPLAHLDIKPENILFDGETALLADFGIARRVDDTGAPATLVAGDPRYWAPEQQMNAATSRSDIFALGTMFFELLAGERPAQKVRIISDRSGRTALIKALPRSFRKYGDVIADCLQEDPSLRPSAESMLQSLSTITLPATTRRLVASVVAIAAVAIVLSFLAVRQDYVVQFWRSVFPLPVYTVTFSLSPERAVLWVDGKERTFREVPLTEGIHHVVALADGYVARAEKLSVTNPAMQVEYTLMPSLTLSDRDYLSFSRNFGVEGVETVSASLDPGLQTLVELDKLSKSSPEQFEDLFSRLLLRADAGDSLAATVLFYAAFEGVQGVGEAQEYLPGLNAASDNGYPLASLLGALYVMHALRDEGKTFDDNPQAFARVQLLLQRATVQGLPETAALAAASAGIPITPKP
ncbi:MAG: serine/threonine-protein kinase [Halioglobus sp.]